MATDVRRDTEPSVDFLILGDRVEVLNNKLYLLGGGWDQVSIPNLQMPILLGMAVAFRVPWHATNRQHNWSLSIQTQDAQVLMQVNGSFTSGRPPGLAVGSDQRAMIGIPLIPLRVPQAGTHVIVAAINGEEKHRISFQVNLIPAPPQVQVGGEPPPL